jgi:hypothetical protein
MASRERECLICDKPILPGEDVAEAGHDVMHEACLPSARRQSPAKLTLVPRSDRHPRSESHVA